MFGMVRWVSVGQLGLVTRILNAIPDLTVGAVNCSALRA